MQILLFAISAFVSVAATNLRADTPAPVPLCIWTETPDKNLATLKDWERFYQRMAGFVKSNRVGLSTTHLILRVLNPIYVSKRDRVNVWADPKNSPLLTDLITTLDGHVGLKFYPYMAEEGDRQAWATIAESGDPLEGVFVLANRWNIELERLGLPHRFDGVVLAIDEFAEGEVGLRERNIAYLKRRYNIATISFAIQYEDVTRFHKYRPFVDYFYFGVFDLYSKSVKRITLSASTSPFSLNPTDHAPVIEFIKKEVFYDPEVIEMYTHYGHQIIALWSAQNKGSSDCIYPLRGTCGHNYEVGTWGPDVAHAFFVEVTKRQGMFATVHGHGIFEFDLMPTSWE